MSRMKFTLKVKKKIDPFLAKQFWSLSWVNTPSQQNVKLG